MSQSERLFGYDAELVELRRQDQVLQSLTRMLSCKRRGLCLMHEWFRHYGTSGSSCLCHNAFEEHLCQADIPLDEGH